MMGTNRNKMGSKMERRIIHTSILDDDWYLELEADEKAVFIWCLLSTNSIGIYRYSLNMIAYCNKLEPARVKQILAKFETEGKVLYKHNYVIIANHFKYYSYDNPGMAGRARTTLNEVPEEIKNDSQLSSIIQHIQEKINNRLNTKETQCRHSVETVSRQSRDSVTHSNSNSNSNSNRESDSNRKDKKTISSVSPKLPGHAAENILAFWNSKEIRIHRRLTTDITNSIKSALNKYSEAEIIEAIQHYAAHIHTEGTWHNQNPDNWLPLHKFLKQANGIATWLDVTSEAPVFWTQEMVNEIAYQNECRIAQGMADKVVKLPEVGSVKAS
jgi:hypothetical protein